MFPTNPAITDGVSLFVWIVVLLIGVVAALTAVDFRNINKED